ncbi:VCBS repeat-containing protein [Spirosoma luteolum]
MAQSTLFRPLPASQTAIAFRNDIDENEQLNVLSYEYFYNGAGVAAADFNNDGLIDLFFTANLKPNKLYINAGGLTFKDQTREAGTELAGRPRGWKTGVTVGDVNNDGWVDLYVCYSGKGDEATRRNQLFINEGFGKDGKVHFKEQAKLYGLDDPGYSTQAAFFDYDRDGDLDLFLLNHNVKKYDNLELARLHGETDALAGNKLFENQGNRFVDVSQKAGIYQYPLTFGLGVAIADINRDGWPDLYVTNDYNEPDYLYINQKNGTFRESTQQQLRHLSQFSMGVDIADYNNDGLPDIMSLDMLPEDNRRQKLLQLQENYESFELMVQQNLHRQFMRNTLQLNNGNGPDGLPSFSEIAQVAGVSNTDWSWAPLLADFDNDGYKDLFITNGYLRDYTNKDFLKYWGDYKVKKAIDREPVQLMDLVKAMPATKVANYIFQNQHNLTFANRQQAWGINTPTISSGAAYADLDNDGDLELIVNNINEPATIYQNMAREQNRNAFVQLKLRAVRGDRSAIGTKVTVFAAGQQQYQELQQTRGYLSAQPATLHLGLGTATQIDSIVVEWPDQTRQVLRQQPINQLLTIEQVGNDRSQWVTPSWPAVFLAVSSVLPYTHEGFAENDFKRQPLMLWMYSNTGPVLARGDVNHDGLTDVFVSGDQKQPGAVWLQQPAGRFAKLPGLTLSDETGSAVSAAQFFDANNDGFDDLYLAHGGYSLFEPNTPALQDELYLNDGHGQLVLAKTALPDLSGSSKSCVRPADYDGDGDLDLFVGGRVVPGRYPETPVSYLLKNNGAGQFSRVPMPFAMVGMVTDAQWADLDADNRPDLILCGEFMPIKVYRNTKEGFVDATKTYFPDGQNGFWLSLTVADLNGDGQRDIVAGNLGLNTQIKASAAEPAELLYADFDENGSVDPFFCFYVQGKTYPFVSRDELNDQIYAMRRKFAYYKDYADATATEIFTPEQLSNARRLVVNDLHTTCFLQTNGRFAPVSLPLEAQFAPVTRTLTGDFDKNGTIDLLLLGNKSDNRLKLGSMDANYGCLLAGDGKGGFRYIPQPQSGLSVSGDVKSALELPVGSATYLLIGAMNQPLQLYKPNRP